MAKQWEVVGGGETGGILVRMGEDLKSPAASERLSCGANVEQIELKGSRLKYKLVSGTGPKEGWVSISLKGKDLVVQKAEGTRKEDKRASTNIGIDQMLALHHSVVKFKDLYSYDEEKHSLGEGGAGTVFEALHKGSKDTRAVKKIAFRKQSELEALDSELKILIKLDHPNIMKFYEYFQEPKLIYLVTELCSGGSFIDFFEPAMFDIEDARILFKDVVSAVHYCHTNNVLHRDIKPENCLIDEPDGRPVAKVIDFGVSKIIQSSKKTEDGEQERTGTPFYRAPEVLEHSYGPKSDMFSVGVTIFLCLTGTHPLHGSSFRGAAIGCEEQMGMFDDIDEGPLDDEDIAEKPRDLIWKLMEKDKNKRLSALEALSHPWLEPPTTKKFVKKGTKSSRMRESCGGLSSEVQVKNAAKRIQKEAEIVLTRATHFKSLDGFHAAILRLIAHHSHASEVSSLREHFARVDTDKSGTVDKGELEASLKASGMEVSKEDLAEIFTALDTHQKGEIRYSEWIAATMKPDIVKAESSVNEVWCFFDTDNSGEISFDEIKDVLGAEIAEQCLKKINKKSLTKKDFKDYMEVLAEEAKHVN